MLQSSQSENTTKRFKRCSYVYAVHLETHMQPSTLSCYVINPKQRTLFHLLWTDGMFLKKNYHSKKWNESKMAAEKTVPYVFALSRRDSSTPGVTWELTKCQEHSNNIKLNSREGNTTHWTDSHYGQEIRSIDVYHDYSDRSTYTVHCLHNVREDHL